MNGVRAGAARVFTARFGAEWNSTSAQPLQPRIDARACALMELSMNCRTLGSWNFASLADRGRERERERERIIGQREHFVSRSISESARDNCSLLLPFPLFPRFRSTTERETEAIHSVWRDKQNLIRAEAERRGQLQRVKVWH
jgi:hypothetical protein